MNNNPIIIDKLIYFIGGVIFFIIVFVISRKKHRANEKELLQKVSNAVTLKKNKAGRLEGTHKGKEIVIYYEDNTILKIKTYFFNASEFLKSKPQTFPAPCFSLYKKNEFSKK